MTAQRGVALLPISRSLLPAMVATVASGASIVWSASIAWASGFALDDDSAVVLGSDGVLYALNLQTAVAIPGETVSGGTFQYLVSAIEADPTTDAVWALNQSTTQDIVLADIDTTSGVSTLVKSDYGADEVHRGIVRTNDNTTYLAHVDHLGAPTSVLSTLNLATGQTTTIGPTDLGGINQAVLALAAVGDTVYAWIAGGADAVYTVNTATGELTLAQAASGSMSSLAVVGADTTADGTVYLLGVDDGGVAYLYTTDLAGNSTLIGPITGLGESTVAENLAIATLLTSERSEPEETEETEETDDDPAESPSRTEGDRADSGTATTTTTGAQLAPTGVVVGLIAPVALSLAGIAVSMGVGLLWLSIRLQRSHIASPGAHSERNRQ